MIRSLFKLPLLFTSQGLTAKVGQILAQGSSSHRSSPSLTHSEALSILKSEFQIEPTLEEKIFAASMGQVFIMNYEGKRYAVKILHPGIREKIEKEIEQFLVLGAVYAKTSGFDFQKEVFRRFLNGVFTEETDLIREADFQKSFKKHFPEIVPEVIPDFSNSNVLTQEYREGNLDHIPDFAIFDFFFRSLFEFGLLHGDLNDRNWGYENGKLVVYDYGCSQIISGRRRNGLRKLFMNVDVASAFREAGIRLDATVFKGREQELRNALFDFREDYSVNLQNKFGDSIKTLREYADPWLLLFMRSFFSIIKAYQARKIEIPMEQILSPHLKKSENGRPELLKIEVMEEGKQIVYLTYPLSEIKDLPNLIPPKVIEKFDVQKVIAEALMKEEPNLLLDLALEKRTYKIWTE